MNAFQNCKTRLMNRGFEFVQEFDEFQVWRKDANICVLMLEIVESVNVKRIEKILSILEPYHFDNKTKVIQIYKKSVSSTVKNSTKNQTVTFELVPTIQLQVDILKHALQPKFTLLTKEEAKNVESRHAYNMPQFVSSDPIVKEFDFKKGQVVKICTCFQKECNCNRFRKVQ